MDRPWHDRRRLTPDRMHAPHPMKACPDLMAEQPGIIATFYPGKLTTHLPPVRRSLPAESLPPLTIPRRERRSHREGHSSPYQTQSSENPHISKFEGCLNLYGRNPSYIAHNAPCEFLNFLIATAHIPRCSIKPGRIAAIYRSSLTD